MCFVMALNRLLRDCSLLVRFPIWRCGIVNLEKIFKHLFLSRSNVAVVAVAHFDESSLPLNKGAHCSHSGLVKLKVHTMSGICNE